MTTNPQESDQPPYAIPRWFAWVVSLVLSVALVALVPYARSLSESVTDIRVDVATLKTTVEVIGASNRDRDDDLEKRVERLEEAVFSARGTP